MAQSWDYIAKIVSLGDSGCGKSSFGSRIVPVGPPASLTLKVNNPSANPTPIETSSNADLQNQRHMKLSLWDTAGQETYKSITRSYFRGASGALLVFDITRRATFDAVTAWLNDLRQIAEENIIVVLVGNKSDLAPATTISEGSASENKRQVTQEEAEAWCKENKVMEYVETSAKSGDNVERAFREVAERIYQNIEAGKYDLNDRRSGVKGPGASAGGNTARTINLGMNDAASVQKRAKQGGCC
ncbi:unnamed protein product [Aureobasidium uvarum]|uniref:Secretion related GTPase SrgD n=1 Tax=Aureobasidium uvarum TaxID=2773716 RepID=A0A9N8KNC2_9PEZI|nr:unnamed protein product [Aureobasidium uvarum]